MALVSLSATGMWSSATPWPNGTQPTASDDVRSNGFTVYIDRNVTVRSLNSNGGTFRNAGNYTVNANVSAGTSICLTLTGNGTNTFVVSGNFYGTGSTASAYALGVTGNTSTNFIYLTTIGNVFGPTVASSSTIRIESGYYNHYGTSTGGTNTNSAGIEVNNSNNLPVVIFLSGGPFNAGTGNTANGFSTGLSLAGSSFSSSSITIIGTISGGPSSPGGQTTGINNQGNIPTYITGNVYGGGAFGCYFQGSGTHNIVGNIYSGPVGGTGNVGVYNNGSTTTVNITGDVYAMATSNNPTYGVQNGSNGIVNIVGNIYGSPATNTGAAVYSPNNNRITITGNVSAGNVQNAYGVYLNNISYLTIYGNVTGGAATTAYGVNNNSTGYVVISGIAQGGIGSNAHGVFNNTGGTVYVKRAKANSYGPGSAVTNIAYGAVSNTQASNTIVEELEFGANGLIPTLGNIVLKDLPTNVVDFYTTAGGRKTLIDPNSGSIMPPVSSVRLGVSYSGDNLVGTCAMPSISSVDFGTSVDNSTGIAALFTNDVWNTTNNTLTATSLSATIGYRLINVSTTESAGQTLAAYSL